MTEQPESMADKRPHFVTQARPLAVPPELLALPDDALISEEHKIGRQNGNCSGFTVRDYREMIEATIARQAEEFFTVNEAAQILADARPGKTGPEWVRELRAAYRAGVLAIRDPSTRIPFRPANPFLNVAIPNTWTADGDEGRDFLDLVRGADVDAWLRTTAGYGFPTAGDAGGAVEGACERQRRRLERLRQLGGDRVKSGPGWKAAGKRGALAALVQEEKAAGRQYSDSRDVRKDLDAEADRKRYGRTMPRA